MDELAIMIDKMNARDQSGNKVIVLAATMFLTTSLAYTLFQFSDVNTTFTASLPSLFSFLDYSTARAGLCTLAKWSWLPVDFGSEDPYMIRVMDSSKHHPHTRPMRVCIPIGLGAGIDVNGEGPASFIKLGFGSVEIGSVTIEPSTGVTDNSVQLLANSIVAPLNRSDSSDGLATVATRLCDYLDSRPDDLLTRNTVTGISVVTSSESDVDGVFANKRLIETADYISLDASKVQDDYAVVKLINRIDARASECPSIPILFLKVSLAQSLPPSAAVVAAIVGSKAVVGVNVNGAGVASGGNKQITKFDNEQDVMVAGYIVKERSTDAVSEWYKALGRGKTGKEVIASGGVSCGKDALQKLEAGASMVNVFSAFVHDGPSVARRIKTQLSVQLMNSGYYNISEAIGARHREQSKKQKSTMKRRKRF